MALVLDATVGGANANAYADLAAVSVALEGRLHTEAWDTADTATQEAAIAWATAILDALKWRGRRATAMQRLRWPRNYVLDPDPPYDGYLPDPDLYPYSYSLGYYLPNDSIPPFLIRATAELAFSLLADDRTADAETKGLRALSVGPLSLTFDPADRRGPLPDEVRRIIRPYLADMDNTVRRA